MSIDVVTIRFNYRLDVFDNRGIETQIWTNLCDKFRYSTKRMQYLALQVVGTRYRQDGLRFVKSLEVGFIPLLFLLYQFDVVYLNSLPEQELLNQVILLGYGHLHMKGMRFFILFEPHRNTFIYHKELYVS